MKSQTTLTDKTAHLLSSVKAGNAVAFTDLYNLTYRYVKKVILNKMDITDDWEDVLQETYLAIYRQIPTLQNPKSGLAWIKQIAFHKTCDYCRKKYDHDAFATTADHDDLINTADPLPIPEEILESREMQTAVREAIDALPDVQRFSVIGFYYNGSKIREIATEIGIPVGTVKTALHRGRKALSSKLEAFAPARITSAPIVVKVATVDGYVVSGAFFICIYQKDKSSKERLVKYHWHAA